MAKMTLKEALESDEVRSFMNDVIEAEVSKALVARGLGTGAGRLAARDVLAASSEVPSWEAACRRRGISEATIESLGSRGSGVLDAGGDAA